MGRVSSSPSDSMPARVFVLRIFVLVLPSNLFLVYGLIVLVQIPCQFGTCCVSSAFEKYTWQLCSMSTVVLWGYVVDTRRSASGVDGKGSS